MPVPYCTSFKRASTTRYQSTHATCSAFSSSANPDEDWTTISDLAERRRIQNRIAQRNYRRKLKRRLEDLERRVGPAPVSTSQMHVEVRQPYCTSEKLQLETRPDSELRQQASPRTLPSHYTRSVDDHEKTLSRGFDRNGSRMPPLVACNTYLAPKEVLYRPYPDFPSQSYRPTLTSGDYENYITPIPLSPPSMIHFPEAIKREGDDNMNPYNIYDNSSFHAINLHSRHYEDPNFQVSRSFSPVATSASAPSLAAAGPFRTSRNNMFEQTPAPLYCYDQMVYYSKSCGYQYPPTQ